MNKIFLTLIFGIFLIGIVSSSVIEVNNNSDYFTRTVSTSGFWGMRILSTADNSYITKIEVNKTVTADRCFIATDSTGAVVLAQGNIVGFNCTLSTNYTLTKGVSYYVGVNKTTGAYNVADTVDGGVHFAYPVRGTYINWTAGFVPPDSLTQSAVIRSITIEDSGVGTNTLFSPANNTLTTTQSTNFNCSSSIPSGQIISNVSLLINGVVNYTVSDGVGNFKELYVTRTLPVGYYNWSCSARKDTNVQVNSTLRFINITTIIENSQNYSLSTTEGGIETFYINISKYPYILFSYVNFVYNGTKYSSSFSNDNEQIISKQIAIPSLNTITNLSFYWEFIFTDGTKINSTSYNQSVGNLQLDDCSVYTNVIYNYTMYDEETKNKLSNTTMEIQINLYDYLRTIKILSYSKKFTETNPARVCFNGALSTNLNYSVDSVVKYYSNDSGNPYVIRYYNILNQIITNSTVPKNINLYDLLSSKNTDFQLTFKDSNLAFAPNILVYVYRQYIEDNDYKAVEVPLTDSNGQTVLHLVRNDVLYNFVFVNSEGEIIATFNRVIAFCQDYTIGSCSINLNAISSSDVVYNYLDDLGISYTSPSYDSTTNEISFTFASTNLSTVTITMEVIRNNDFGNRSVCTNSLTSSTGTLTCDVSAVKDTDRFLFVNIYVNGELKIMETIDLKRSSSGFGIVNGGFYAFLIILFLICFFMDDKQTLVFSLLIGWAIVIALALINGAIIGSLSGGIWLIVCIIIFLWKLKKEEKGA